MAAAVARTRVHAQWEGLALASEAVVHSPVFGLPLHQKVHAAAITHLVAAGLVPGLGVFYCGIGKSHLIPCDGISTGGIWLIPSEVPSF